MGSLHGFEIDCDRELKRLSAAPGSLGLIRVHAAAETPLERPGELVRLMAGPDAIPVSALARCDGQLVSWHVDGGSFLIDPAEGRISYRLDDASVERRGPAWEHRLGSSVLPVLGGERGGLPLHASAVGVGGQALLICGVTGRGKSTLAATLVARGHEAIAEDGVVIYPGQEGPLVWPGLAGSMITAEAAAAAGVQRAGSGRPDARGRLYSETPRAAAGATAVGAVVVLLERGGDRVELIAPRPAKAHRELLAHAIGADRRGVDVFGASARLIERVPVRLLVAPDSVAKLPAAAEALERLIASRSSIRPTGSVRLALAANEGGDS